MNDRRIAGDVTGGLLLLVAPVVTAAVTGWWVLTAVSAGVLLGFFLAKGDLCGASAFSEILLMRDGRKLFGLVTAAVTAMVLFAIGDDLGLVNVVPRPLHWASYTVAGVVFGVGMVLAGGCVSGSLYKAGSGHVNSMVALGAIPVGMHLVDFGPLHGLDVLLRRHLIPGAAGFPELLGMPFGLLAAICAVATLLLGILHRRPPPAGAMRRRPSEPFLLRVLTRPWRPAWAGVAIGLLAFPAWLSSLASGRDFPLCVSYGMEELPLLATNATIISRPGVAPPMPGGDERRIYLWLVLFVVAVVLGALLAARLTGKARIYPRPRGQILAAAIGGLLVGIGAALARGCILGNGVMGLALLSVGMVQFAVVAMLANWATTRFWVMGG